MRRDRSYWTYSAALAAVWAVALFLTRAVRGEAAARQARLVCAGYCLAWVSTTIARYIYPPPTKWTSNQATTLVDVPAAGL